METYSKKSAWISVVVILSLIVSDSKLSPRAKFFHALFLIHIFLIFSTVPPMHMYSIGSAYRIVCFELKSSAVWPAQVSPWHRCSHYGCRFHTLRCCQLSPAFHTTCNMCSLLKRLTTLSKTAWATKYHMSPPLPRNLLKKKNKKNPIFILFLEFLWDLENSHIVLPALL